MFRDFRIWWPAVVSGCLAFGVVTPADASEVLTDIILLVDTSASMREIEVGEGQKVSFQRLTDRLQTFVDAGLPTNSNVTVITFGEDIHVVLQIQVKDTADRKKLQAVLGNLKPKARRTYTTKGISYGISEIARLKKEFPSHYRLLFLLTDGENNPPREGGPPTSFDQVRGEVRDRLKLQPNEDFYLWYAHIGDPDPELQQLTAEWDGDRKPFEGDWRIGRFNFNRRTIHLPPQLPGDWVAHFPSQTDIDRGDTLSVQGYGVDGRALELGPVVVPDLPAGAKIEVGPATINLTDKDQQVTLQFHGNAVPPGKYTGRVQMTPPSGFVIASPRFFHLDFQVARPLVSVEPAEKLDLGAMTPTTTAKGQVVMNPTPSAVLLKTNVTVKAIWDNASEGLMVEVQPSEFMLVGRQPIEISAALGAKHSAEPGVITGRLLFEAANRYVTFEPAKVPMSLELKPQVVRLLRSEFSVEPQPDGTFNLTLSASPEHLPPAGAAFLLGDTRAATETDSAAPQLALQTSVNRFTADEPGVTLSGKLAERPEGHWAYTVPLQSDDSLVAFEPPSISLMVSVGQPSVDIWPKDALDFGKVTPGEQHVRKMLVSPNEAAMALGASVNLTAEGLSEGVTAECRPQRVDLNSPIEIEVALKAAPDAPPGAAPKAQLKLVFSPESVATSSAVVALNYNVLSKEIRIDTESLTFENVPPGDSKAEETLRVVGGEHGKGKTLTASLQWTDELPDSMTVLLSPQHITLADTSDTVPLTLSITGAPAGKYHGSIDFSVTDAVVTPSQVTATLVVGEAAVVVHLSPIRVPSWRWDRECRWPVTVEANRFAEGALLTIDAEGDLPPGIQIGLDTPELQLVQGENTTEVVLRWDGQERPDAGSYQASLAFRTDRPELLVNNASVPIEITVPRFTPTERALLITGALALILVAIAAWLYWPRTLVGMLRVESLGSFELFDETGSYKVDDSISLEHSGQRHLHIGAEDDCQLRIKPGSGYCAVIGRGRRTYVRRPRHGSRPVKMQISEDTEVHLEPGQSCPLQYGDKIVIHALVLVYED